MKNNKLSNVGVAAAFFAGVALGAAAVSLLDEDVQKEVKKNYTRAMKSIKKDEKSVEDMIDEKVKALKEELEDMYNDMRE